MSDTIKGAGDVYEADLYGDLKKSGEQALVVLNAINEAFKEQTKASESIINVDPKDFKSLKQVNDEISKTNKVFNDRIKVDKERLKVQRTITKAEQLEGKAISDLDVKVKNLTAARNRLLKKAQEADEQTRAGNEEIGEAIELTIAEQAELAELSKQLILVKTERTELNKENKKLAQESLGLLDLYQLESKRLIQLRKDFKNLVLSEKASTEETEALAKEIDDLDKKLKAVDASVGQFQRNVGNYPDLAEDAADATEELGDETENTTTKIIKFAAAAVAAQATLSGFKSSLEGSAEASEELRLAQAALEGGTAEFGNVVASAALDAKDLFTEIKDGNVNILDLAKSIGLAQIGFGELDKSETALSKTFDRTTEATTGFTDKVIAAAEAEIEAEKRAIAFEKALRPLELRLSQLNKVISVQNAIAGDQTRSFNEIEEAAIKAQEAQVQRSNINIKIAQEELAILRIRLNAQREAGRNVEELLNQETDALVKLQDARTEAAVEELETTKLLRENARDRFERELDFAIDAFDAQKTVNERRIANEKENLQLRRDIFDETVLLADKSFQSQVKLLEDFTKQKLDLDSLVIESDEAVIRQRLKNFNFDDVTLGRILEIIKERKLALQDLTDAQVEINAAEQDAIDIRKDIIAQEEALGKISEDNVKQSTEALENLEKDREANEIANLKRRLDLAKEGSKEALEIQQELNDALLDQQDERIQEQQQREEEAAERRLEIQKATFGLLERLNKASSDRRLDQIDEELDASEKQADRLRDLADKGVLGADKSLAAEEKKQAELKRQAAEEERQQELRSAALKILSALLEQGRSPQEAIPEVGLLLGALPAVIEALPSFFEGTEDTGKAKRALDSKGGRLSILHDNERVIDQKNNKKMGGVSNAEAADIVHRYNKGMLGDLYNYNQPNIDQAINTNWKSNEDVLNKFDELKLSLVQSNQEVKKAIEHKPAMTDIMYNKMIDQIVISMESKGKKYNTYSKPKRRLS